MRWTPFAMVRIASVFIAGVLVGIFYPELLIPEMTLFLIILSGTLYFGFYAVLKNDALRVFSGATGMLIIFLSGLLNVGLRNESRQPDHLSFADEEILFYKVKLIAAAEEKKNSFRRQAEIEAVATDSGWKRKTGRVYLYFPKSEPVRTFDYGDKLLIKGKPRLIDAPMNPGEFDFRKFLEFRNIFHQQFVKAGEWSFAERSQDHGFWYFALRSRAWAVEAIQKYVHEPRQQAITIALVLGVTDGVDNELLSAYAASGAMHVLAVSGMHISIIYAVLLLLLKPLKKFSGGEWIIAIFSLTLLWMYAFITGLSPSVLRAVAMFSFVAVAGPFARRTNIYNTLAASAFFLLIYDPFLIMSVGFQLSYLAVWGIVYLYRPIYNVWLVKSWLLNWLWQITSVSIAAQIATLPLVLFYFHQFPLYSLLANVFVIPGSTVILLGGVLLLLISPLTAVATWTGLALQWFVKFFNGAIFYTEDLPMSLLTDIYLTPAQTLTLALILIFIMSLIQYRRFVFLIMVSAAILVFSAISWIHFIQTSQPTMTAYAINRHSAVDWSENGYSIFYSDSALINDVEAIRFHVQPARVGMGVSLAGVSQMKGIEMGGMKLIAFKEVRILIMTSKNHHLPEWIKVDYLIVANNSIKSLAETVKHINFNRIIFDGSNSLRYCRQMKKEAEILNIECDILMNDGSLTIKF